MDLALATEKEIAAELARRKIMERNKEIDSCMDKINAAHKNGRISIIKIKEANIGTSVATTAYFVHLKDSGEK